MKRVPEPELMKDDLQVKAYSEADFSKSDNEFIESFFRFNQAHGKEINSDSLILDLGCGPGNITELISRKWPFANVVGIDGSLPMILEATRRKELLNLPLNGSMLSYKLENISSDSQPLLISDLKADYIVSNSFLHHFHNPMNLWRTIISLALPGTITFHRDLRRPKTLEDLEKLRNLYLPNAPQILEKDFIASLKAAFSEDEINLQLKKIGLSSLKVKESGDRYIDIYGVL